MRFVSVFMLASVFVQTFQQPKDLLGLLENDTCHNSGVKGICTRLDKCTTGVAAIKAGKHPRICSFIGDTPVVCCPSENTVQTTSQAPSTSPGEGVKNSSVNPGMESPQPSLSKPHPTTSIKSAILKAKEKCAEYAKSVVLEVDSPVLSISPSKDIIDLCARVEEPRVVGGQYPHMALIGYNEENIEWLCGGSLISERYILSAAHCSYSRLQGPAIWVKLGELDMGTESDDAFPQIIRIEARSNHPEYRPVKAYNDISLFKLERNVKFNIYIRPTCLAMTDDEPWKTAIATGWGKTDWKGVDGSRVLMNVKLNLVNSEQCNNTYQTSRNLPQGILNASMICAGDKPGQDTCQGDSGGPLQIPINDPYCMYELIGITSFGRACGFGVPGVYTRVSYFLPWIVDQVWPE